MAFRRVLISCIWLLCIHVLPTACPQEPVGMPRLTIPDKTPEVLAPGIRQDAIIMRNGMGESVFVPKSKYEELENFLNSKSSDPASLAKDLLERLELDIAIDPSIARIKVNALASLPEANANWISVPIALGTLQPIPQTSVNDASDFPPLRVSSDKTGYVWRVAPGVSGIRYLHFDALSKVRSMPQGFSLRLDMPPVQTVVRFELPLGQWDINVIGNGSEITEPFQDVGAKSVAIIRSSGGATTITWTKRDFAEQVQAIEVVSNTKYVSLMEAGEFRAATNLTIRGPKTLGGRRFLIGLPPKSQWREPMASSQSFPGYRLGKSDSTHADSPNSLLLEFEEAFSRTEMELPIEWQTSDNDESNRRTFSILRVEGVQRHIGSIEIAVPRNVSFRWDPQLNIQFARQSQSNDGSDSLNYLFRFQHQNEPLYADWNDGDRASDLKASYNVEVDANILRLNGSIDLLGDVRSLPFLQLDVRGWTVERVQLQPSGRDLDLNAIRSRSTVDPGGAQQNTSIPLSLGELLDAMLPKTGTLGVRPLEGPTNSTEAGLTSPSGREENTRQPTRSISFVLSLPQVQPTQVEEAKQEFGFSLPMLSWLDPESQQRQSSSIGGELLIRSTTAELEPAASMLDSFKQIVEPKSINRYSTLRYRLEKAKSWQEWAGKYEPLGSIVDTNSQTKIFVTSSEIDFVQTWRLVQTSGRIKSLRLAVPKGWMIGVGQDHSNAYLPESIRLSVDDIPVSMKPIQDSNTVASVPYFSPGFDNRYTWMQIELPPSQRNAELVSERRLIIRKKINHDSPVSTSVVPFDWLLPWIASDKPDDSLLVGKSTGEIVLSNDIRCVVQSLLGGVEGNATTIPFDRTQMEPRLIGNLSFLPALNEMEVDVESVWLQTIVNAIEQRDRHVLRFKTRGSSLALSLPAIRMANAVFIINGNKVVPSFNDINRVDLPLDSGVSELNPSIEKSYVLEVFIWSAMKSQWLKTLSAEPLAIIHSTSRAPFAWQVVVPSSVHVIGNTSTLSPGYRWKWQDLWFGRKSEWNQDTLSSFMGATSQPFVSQQTNQYVFFSLDHTASMKVSTAPRILLWAPVALFVLIISFLAMEFRWMRRPWIIVILLLFGLAFSQWAWDLTIALVQCLIIAFGIAAIYAILKWGVDRRARRRSVFALRPSSPAILGVPLSIPSFGVAVLAKSAGTVMSVASKASDLEKPLSSTHARDGDGRQ